MTNNDERAPRNCENPDCGLTFTPTRKDQRFHTAECRKAYWSVAYKWTPHPCPLCTVVHDPDERPILDALERVISDRSNLVLDGLAIRAGILTAFIARRRDVLAGKST